MFSLWECSSRICSASSTESSSCGQEKGTGSRSLKRGVIEGIFNVAPFFQLCIQLNVYKSTGDRAMTKSLLYLEKICSGLVIVQCMSMPQAVERIPPGFPPQFIQTVLKDLGRSCFADMGTRPLSGKEPVVWFCIRTAFCPVLVRDLTESISLVLLSKTVLMQHGGTVLKEVLEYS